jgi:phosphinothricin acetyltransferase
MTIREATALDLPGIGSIYNQVVATTFAIFTDDPIGEERLRAWFESRQRDGYAFLVAEQEGLVVGYATYGAFRGVSGYGSTVENAVHVAPSYRGGGVGTLLMQELLLRAKENGFHVMVAAIDSENDGSLRLHARLGFEVVGRMPEIARKGGLWRTLTLMQKRLS